MNEPANGELSFRFVTDHSALAFTATVGERWRGRFERLRSPDDLVRWFREAAVVSPSLDLVATEAELVGARQLREAIYVVAKAWADAAKIEEPPALADLEAARRVVTQWTRRPAAGRALLVQSDGRWEAGWVDPTVADLLSELARRAIDLLTPPLANRIRECAADDCALLYVDASRGRARRWCSMDSCGARSKMSAYRERLRHPLDEASS